MRVQRDRGGARKGKEGGRREGREREEEERVRYWVVDLLLSDSGCAGLMSSVSLMVSTILSVPNCDG